MKPVVRTQRSYKRAGFKERQKYFQGLAMYGHEVLMPLQKRAELFGIHFSSEVAVKSCCVFVLRKHKAAGLLLVRLTLNSG
jgi:hypothetical protein